VCDVFFEGQRPVIHGSGTTIASKQAVSALREEIKRLHNDPPAGYLQPVILSLALSCSYATCDTPLGDNSLALRSFLLGKLLSPAEVYREKMAAAAMTANPTLILADTGAEPLPTGPVVNSLRNQPSFESTTRSLQSLIVVFSALGVPPPPLRQELVLVRGDCEQLRTYHDVTSTLRLILLACPGSADTLSPLASVYTFAVVEEAVKLVMQAIRSCNPLSYRPIELFQQLERIRLDTVALLKARNPADMIAVANRFRDAETGIFGSFPSLPPVAPAPAPARDDRKRNPSSPAGQSPPPKRLANAAPLLGSIQLSMKLLVAKGLIPPKLSSGRNLCLRYQLRSGCSDPACEYSHDIPHADGPNLSLWAARVLAAFPPGHGV
jgi:hypothetical protein